MTMRIISPTYTINHFLRACAEGRIADLHNSGRRRTVPFCTLPLHNSSALQGIIQGNQILEL